MKHYTKEQSREGVEKLVDQFRSDEEIFVKEAKEENVETKYLRPLFDKLNWNTRNEDVMHGRQEFYIRYPQKVGKDTKEPDYLLRVVDPETERMRGVLFIEAKRPKIELSRSLSSIRQAYQYAHNTLNKSDYSGNRVRLSLLTDFEEFRLFDCQDPYPLTCKDVSVAHFNKCIVDPFDWTYENYVSDFDLLWDTFEKNNVRAGSLDDYRVTNKDLKKRRIAPDVKFLDELKKWRFDFAKSMYKTREGKVLGERILTAASQLVINRLIFLKMLADRGIERDYLTDILRELEKNSDGEVSLYDSCRHIFRELEEFYDGDIFERRDELDYVMVENEVLKSVLDKLRPERSIYSMSAMPVEVIGNIYESFLGEVIKKSGRGLKPQFKPEYQKTKGAYYTPRYIVDYIVDNTLGVKLEECKTPDDVAKIKILDPACGSGSFLIGAYEKVLDWHVDYFRKRVTKLLKKGNSNSEIQRKLREYAKLYFPSGYDFVLHLSSKLKKSILNNNIFGVDIDAQAVEVARFSLSMKALEGATSEELHEDRNLFKTTILPDLKENIKCGDSLVSREDLYYFEAFADYDIKRFDWKNAERGFGDVFSKHGGFHCIIGNPPYIKAQMLELFQPKAKEIYKRIYKSGSRGNVDIYLLFIERAMELLATDGLVGYICPHKFFNSANGDELRKIISGNKCIYKVLHFGVNQVFHKSTTYTCLLFLSGNSQKTLKYYRFEEEVPDLEDEVNDTIEYFDFDENKVTGDNWYFLKDVDEEYYNKVRKGKPTLDSLTTNIFQGPKPGADDVFILRLVGEDGDDCICYSKSTKSEHRIELSILRPYVKGKYIRRYHIDRKNEVVIFPYDNEGKLYTSKQITTKYPKAWAYLSEKGNYKTLTMREKGKFRKTWWQYSRPQNMLILDRVKIITPFNAFERSYAYDDRADFIFSAGLSGANGILLKEDSGISYEYLLGLLNSRVIDYYLKLISTALRGGYFSYENKYIKCLPIYKPTFDDKDKLEISKEIEMIVKQINGLSGEKARADDISFLEDKIDYLVCQLYDLTSEEMNLIGVSSSLSTNKDRFFNLLNRAVEPPLDEEES